MRRSVLLASLSTLALSTVVPLTGTPALAHNELRSSTPTNGAALTSAPPSVVLTFVEEVDAKSVKIAATGADGRSIAQGAPQTSGYLVTQPLNATLTGTYTVAYRVVSLDGHPVQGTVKFSLTLPASASAEPTPSQAEPTPSKADPTPSKAAGTDTDGDRPWWPYAILGLLLVALIGVGVVLATKRRAA